MANQATAASRLPKPSKNQDERVSIASAPRSSSGSSKLPVRSNRATGVITGLRRPASKSTSSDITAISSQTNKGKQKALPSPPTTDLYKGPIPAGRTLLDASEPVTTSSVVYPVLKPLPTPPAESSPELDSSSTTIWPLSSPPSGEFAERLQVLHTSGVEVKGALSRPASLIKASPVKPALRVLPKANSLILGTAGPSSSTPTTATNRTWPARLSSLPKPASHRVSSNGPAIDKGERNVPSHKILPKSTSSRVTSGGSPVGKGDSSASSTDTLGGGSGKELRSPKISFFEGLTQHGGLEKRESLLSLRQALLEFDEIIRVAEDIYRNGKTISDKIEGHKYLFSALCKIHIIKCMKEMEAIQIRIDQMVKYNDGNMELIKLHLEELKRINELKEPETIVKRIKSKIRLIKGQYD